MRQARKRVLLIAASILAARKLAQYEGGTRVPATISAIGDAIRWAEQIMAEIDSAVAYQQVSYEGWVFPMRGAAHAELIMLFLDGLGVIRS